MRSIILAAALFAAGAALAEDAIFKNGNLSVRLTKKKCEIPALAAALAAKGGKAQWSAVVTHGDKSLRGCWALDSENDVLVGDEMRNSGVIPMMVFKPAPSI